MSEEPHDESTPQPEQHTPAPAKAHNKDTPPAAPADAPASGSDARQRPIREKKARARRVLRLGIAGISFLFGLIASPYAEELIMRTNPGFFGPDNQQVIDEQQANFAHLESKLKELSLVAGDDPKAQALIAELQASLNEQRALANKQNELFKATDIEKQMLADRLREQRGTGAAVDFWIQVGESVTLVDPDISFAVIGLYSSTTDITVNLKGEKQRVSIGDPIVFDTSKGKHAVIFRQARRDSDKRFGFDLTRTDRLETPAQP